MKIKDYITKLISLNFIKNNVSEIYLDKEDPQDFIPIYVTLKPEAYLEDYYYFRDNLNTILNTTDGVCFSVYRTDELDDDEHPNFIHLGKEIYHE